MAVSSLTLASGSGSGATKIGLVVLLLTALVGLGAAAVLLLGGLTELGTRLSKSTLAFGLAEAAACLLLLAAHLTHSPALALAGGIMVAGVLLAVVAAAVRQR